MVITMGIGCHALGPNMGLGSLIEKVLGGIGRVVMLARVTYKCPHPGLITIHLLFACNCRDMRQNRNNTYVVFTLTYIHTLF